MDNKVKESVDSMVSDLHTLFDSMQEDCIESKISIEELNNAKEIITDLKKLIEKSETSRMLNRLHFILLNVLFVINEGPSLMDKFDSLATSFLSSYVLRKKLNELKNNIIKKEKEEQKLNLFDKDGRRITIEEIMEE